MTESGPGDRTRFPGKEKQRCAEAEPPKAKSSGLLPPIVEDDGSRSKRRLRDEGQERTYEI